MRTPLAGEQAALDVVDLDRPRARGCTRRALADGAHEPKRERGPAIGRCARRGLELASEELVDRDHRATDPRELLAIFRDRQLGDEMDLAAIAAVHDLVGADAGDAAHAVKQRECDRLRGRVGRVAVADQALDAIECRELLARDRLGRGTEQEFRSVVGRDRGRCGCEARSSDGTDDNQCVGSHRPSIVNHGCRRATLLA